MTKCQGKWWLSIEEDETILSRCKSTRLLLLFLIMVGEGLRVLRGKFHVGIGVCLSSRFSSPASWTVATVAGIYGNKLSHSVAMSLQDCTPLQAEKITGSLRLSSSKSSTGGTSLLLSAGLLVADTAKKAQLAWIVSINGMGNIAFPFDWQVKNLPSTSCTL